MAVNRLLYLFGAILFLSLGNAQAQVPIPSTYPPNGNIYPWGYEIKGTNWNTTPFLPFVYNRMPFRMMLPPGVTYNSSTNTFTNTSGKTFPVLIFLHGLGEIGTENGYNLRHGARNFMNAMNAGQYEGILVWPQNFTEFWGPGQQEIIVGLINNLINKNLADPFRVSINGLSSGGHGVWTSTYFNPKVFASAVPMSAAMVTTIEYIPEFVHIPLWLSQGGKDTRPMPGTALALVDEIRQAGGNIRLSLYEDLGHGTWDRMFTEPDFFPFFMRANKTNPHVFFGQTEFCPGDPISVRMGVTAGFEGYQWRKNGQDIGGATGNEYTATEVGTYAVSIKRNGQWSYYSPIPVEVKIKQPTVTPPIETDGLVTTVVPDPNGSSDVKLKLPEGYVNYQWMKVGSSTVLGTARTITVNGAGDYVATVTEQFGCSSNFSAPFKVIAASGAGAPPAAINLSGHAPSQTSIQLNWSQNPIPQNNETAFEIYRAQSQGGPYTLIHKTAADVTSYFIDGLVENSLYYFVIRAVNNNGGSAVTPEVAIRTQVDSEAPSAPLNLRVNYTMANSVSLLWDASTDNVGVYRYDLYRDGAKVLVTEEPSATLFSLSENTVYNFSVRARDLTGNESAPSNQLTTAPVPNGLDYRYFESTSYTTLPNFNVIAPIKSGHSANVDIAVRNRTNNFAMIWEGKIVIPVAGNYTFETRSKDGSKLYIGGYNESNLVVNNDGVHSAQYREGTRNFPTAGTYPIAITYFNGASGNPLMQVYWKNTASGVGSRQAIPNSAFIGTFQNPGTAPAAPSALVATPVSYNRIDLSWTDNSNNENGFQIFRSQSNDGTYYSVGTTAANIRTFSDTTVEPNTTYYYRVQALGEYGESAFNYGVPRGIDYEYHEANFTSCSQIETSTPKVIGVTPSLDINLRQRTTNFAFQFESLIIIPQTATYTFYLSADDGGLVYLNDKLLINKDATNPAERSANISLTAGIHRFRVLYRQRSGSFNFLVSWQRPGFSKAAIPPSAFRGVDVNTTSLPLPPPPSAPTALSADAISSSEIKLSFTDNSSSELGFTVYRSTETNSSYTSVASLPANPAGGLVQYTDGNLFTNVTYYYKVVARNVGGESAATNEDFAKTLNNSPVLDALANRTVRWGTVTDINLFATDPDAEPLTFSSPALPSFATLTDYGDGTGLLSFDPAQGNIGTYEDITIVVSDQNGGQDSKSFDLVVNSNFLPEWEPVAEQTVFESGTLVLPVTATDADGGALDINAFGVPAFASFVDNGGGEGTLTFNPQYGDHGSYLINMEVVDTQGAATYMTIRVNVEQVNVNYRVLINFNSTAANNGPAPWNNTNMTPVAGSQMLNLSDDKNLTTDMDLTFVTPWGPQFSGVGDFGTVTGNDSGVYPDNVMRSYYFASDTGTKTLRFGGLNPILKYTFVFFGSRVDGPNRIAEYTVDGRSVQLDAGNNTQNTVRIENVAPNASNEILVDVRKVGASQFGYLNAMEVIAFFDNGAIPAAPTATAAVANDDGSITVAWVDNSSSETAFKVYRATSAGGPYTLMKTIAPNTVNYTDRQGLQSLVPYYYKVAAQNFRGEAESNVVNVVIPNKAPVIAPIEDTDVAQMSTEEIQVSATDPENDDITLVATQLPSFVTFVDNGNGTGVLNVSAGAGHQGSYIIQLSAKDELNNQSEPVSFTLNVKEIVTVKTLVNFNDTRNPVGLPWNSWNATPILNRALVDLKDINSNSTGITLTLLDAWTGGNIYGAQTGDNSGVYPDLVMRTFYYYNGPSARRIRVSGLQASKTYNFTFFASREGTGDKTTVYTIGSKSVSLNASDNVSNVVSINGQKANASGEIIISMQKVAASQFAYINAMVIESFEDNGLPLTPSDLVAQAKSRTSINLSWLDNSSNETGFEIFRATSVGGSYTKIATTGPDVISYPDNGLSPNSKYFYKVRAINGIGNSAYSPIASAVTLDYSVYINFDDGRNGIAPAPWNTTARVPLEGDVWLDLKNESGLSTGINMTIVQNFSGSNPFGVNTGNNSGIYPDLVMQSFYYNEVGVTAILKFSGLSPSNYYNLVYFTSRAGTGNRNTDFTVNGQTVTLNASNNTASTVQHSAVLPDSNGEIFLGIKSGEGSVYGYINALVLQTYVDPTGSGSGRMATRSLGAPESSAEGDIFEQLQAYPNPFKEDRIHLQFDASERYDLNISMVTSLGVEVFSKTDYVDFSKNSVEIDLSNRNLNKGLYLIKVMTARGSKILKVIRE